MLKKVELQLYTAGSSATVNDRLSAGEALCVVSETCYECCAMICFDSTSRAVKNSARQECIRSVQLTMS